MARGRKRPINLLDPRTFITDRRKPKGVSNKVSITTKGMLIIGTDLLDKMIARLDKEPHELGNQLGCYSAFKLEKKVMPVEIEQEITHRKITQCYIWFEIWESVKEGEKAMGVTNMEGKSIIRPLNRKRGHYHNIPMIRAIHHEAGGTIDFERFMWEEEEQIPVLKLDEPKPMTKYDKKTEKVVTVATITESHVTATEYTLASGAVEFDNSIDPAIRIWVSEGQRRVKPMKHTPSSYPKNKNRKTKN